MSQAYSQLTYEERIEIKAHMKAQKAIPQIAQLLGRAVSTVRREIARNSGRRGYRPRQAHAKALARHAQPRTLKMTRAVVAHVEASLERDLSPEQIAATMEASVGARVSHERIYRHVWRDKANGGTLWRHLRLAGRVRRRKRYGKKDSRGRIPNRRGIETRPEVVETRSRVGDWEGDLVSGKRHRGFLVTLVERASRMLLTGHVVHKTARSVRVEVIRLLDPFRERVETVTFDNGREFAEHTVIAEALECDCYFARPYHAWERGSNENASGLIRQYVPKDRDLSIVQCAALEEVMARLNNRPRKILGFRAPLDVFFKGLHPPGGRALGS